MPCFPECECTCGAVDAREFDVTIRTESRSLVRLADLVSKHVAWYFEPEVGRDGTLIVDRELRLLLRDLGLHKRAGVYVLWRADGYCEVHEREHLQAQYVGKSGSDAESRIAEHQARKLIGGELPPEISFIPCINRKAKYLEQLLLDTFRFPHNNAENHGRQPLCHHIGPADWN